MNWKFPNLGACELKISKFGGLRAKIWAKIEAVEAKISIIFSKGGLVNWHFCLKWDPCDLQERREKGVFRAAHPHTPFLGQYPPRDFFPWFATCFSMFWILRIRPGLTLTQPNSFLHMDSRLSKSNSYVHDKESHIHAVVQSKKRKKEKICIKGCFFIDLIMFSWTHHSHTLLA